MPAVYIVQQNAKIRINNRRLQVERDSENAPVEVLLSVPLGQVSEVVLFGNVSLTTPAIDALLYRIKNAPRGECRLIQQKGAQTASRAVIFRPEDEFNAHFSPFSP